jgi:hypothetical protein
MKMNLKTFTVTLATAGLLAATGPSIAGDEKESAYRLSDEQMGQVVAGKVFTDTYTTETILWFHGYSNRPAAPGSPGSSEVQFTDTYTREMNCAGGNINSCYAGDTGLNQNTVVNSTTLTDSTSTILSGPGM